MIGMKKAEDLAGMNRLIGPQDMVAIITMTMTDIPLSHHTMVLPIDNWMNSAYTRKQAAHCCLFSPYPFEERSF